MPTGVRIGDREIFLLSMLIDKKLYGYQIAQMIKDHASFFIEIDQSSVYNALRKMEKLDWISVELENAGNAPTRKLYQITKAGKRDLESAILEESRQVRLSILGTLNLIINSSWLPSEQLNAYLSGRILKMKSLISEYSGGHDAAAGDPMTDYLKAQMQLEIEYATRLRERVK